MLCCQSDWRRKYASNVREKGPADSFRHQATKRVGSTSSVPEEIGPASAGTTDPQDTPAFGNADEQDCERCELRTAFNAACAVNLPRRAHDGAQVSGPFWNSHARSKSFGRIDFGLAEAGVSNFAHWAAVVNPESGELRFSSNIGAHSREVDLTARDFKPGSARFQDAVRQVNTLIARQLHATPWEQPAYLGDSRRTSAPGQDPQGRRRQPHTTQRSLVVLSDSLDKPAMTPRRRCQRTEMAVAFPRNTRASSTKHQ